jgi:prepilin-type N-terminal cleavage/methylation domain-containing protein
MRARNKLLRANHLSAFSLIEVLMVLALVGILTVVSVSAIDSVSNDAAFDQTYQRLNLIKIALVGDLDTNKQGIREYFGYIGDMGSLPTFDEGLRALLRPPSGSAGYAVSTTSKTGMGWRGPYLKAARGVDSLDEWLVDAWGNDIVYNTTGTPYIKSLGSDGAVGGYGTASDIQIDLGTNITYATVYGVINKNSIVFDDSATVTLYQPDGHGAIWARTATPLVAGDKGRFSFANVPFGLRSVQVNITTPGSTDVIGPAIIPVDNSNYFIPHNFLDSTPGEFPNVCSNIHYTTFVQGSLRPSVINKRVYFRIKAIKSVIINTVYVQTNTNAKFQAIRINNETKTCGWSSGANEIECCVRSGNSANCGSNGNQTYNETNNFPEMALFQNWTIKAGNDIGAYVQFQDAADVSNLQYIQVRLGCDMVYAQ